MKFSLENLFDFRQLTRHLATGLNRLDLLDNFEGFEFETTIASGAEAQIRNQLKSIPNHVIITKQTGNGNVTAGDTEWDLDFVYMKNHGPSSVTVKMVFHK